MSIISKVGAIVGGEFYPAELQKDGRYQFNDLVIPANAEFTVSRFTEEELKKIKEKE